MGVDSLEVTTVYAISFGAIFLLWMLVTTGLSISRHLYSYGVYYLSKHLVNRQLPQTLRGHAMLTCLDLLLLSLCLAGNVMAIFFGNSTLEDVKKRTSYLAIVNIMPLGLIGRPNMLVDSSGGCRSKLSAPYTLQLQQRLSQHYSSMQRTRDELEFT